LVAECVGQGRLDVADRQTAHERGDHQRFQGIGLGDVLAEQPGGELGRRAAQLRALQRDRPRNGLHRHRPVAITRSGLGVGDRGGSLVAVPAQELGHLGLQRGLHQQLRPEPGNLLQDLGKLTIGGEQLIDLGADTVGR
jgi:hypothetical protein